MKTILACVFLIAAAGSVPLSADKSDSIQRQTCPSIDSIKKASTCLDIIRLLSKCDKCLDSRREQKAEIAKKVNSVDEFVKSMKGRQCNGTEYNCGHTRSYVTEVFQGLATHFDESKYDDGTGDDDSLVAKAKIISYKSGDIKKYFESKANSSNTIIHMMRHTGTHDHVWTVEQLPNGQGYRIYQSYHDGYSLRAWLSEDLTGLFEPDHGDIMLPRAVQNTTDAKIREISGGKSSLTNLTLLKSDPRLSPMLPFAEFLAKYDEKQAIETFKKSWDQFGKGKILSRDVFLSNWLGKLADIVAYFETHDNKVADAYPRDIWDKWIELYAGWDPTYYPGLPNNAIVSQIMSPDKKYRFQVKSVEIQGAPKCQENAQYILSE